MGWKCSGYGVLNGLVQSLSEVATTNLIYRFMALIGFALDGISTVYLIYLASLALIAFDDFLVPQQGR